MDIILDRRAIERLLPHRPPALLLDGATELRPGCSATAVWRVDPALEALRGHFPDEPVVPGVLLLECMAQAAGLVLCAGGWGGKKPLLSGLDRARFIRPVLPGETVTVTARLLSEAPEAAAAVLKCGMKREGKRIASCEVALTMR